MPLLPDLKQLIDNTVSDDALREQDYFGKAQEFSKRLAEIGPVDDKNADSVAELLRRQGLKSRWTGSALVPDYDGAAAAFPALEATIRAKSQDPETLKYLDEAKKRILAGIDSKTDYLISDDAIARRRINDREALKWFRGLGDLTPNEQQGAIYQQERRAELEQTGERLASFTGDTVVRDVAAGAAAGVYGVVGLIRRAGGESQLARDNYDAANEIMGARQARADKIGEGDLRQFIGRNVAGASRSLTQMGAFAATGPLGIIGGGAAIAANDAYERGSDAGLSGGELAAYTTAIGAIEGGLTYGFGKVLGNGIEGVLGREALSRAVNAGALQAVKTVGVEILKEIPEELAIGIAQAAVDKVAGVDPNALSADSLAELITDTVAQTILLSGTVHGIDQGLALATKKTGSGVVQAQTNAALARELAMSPEREGKIADLAARAGVSPEMLRNLPDNLLDTDITDAEAVAARVPALRQWMASGPDNVTVSKGDHLTLAQIAEVAANPSHRAEGTKGDEVAEAAAFMQDQLRINQLVGESLTGQRSKVKMAEALVALGAARDVQIDTGIAMELMQDANTQEGLKAAGVDPQQLAQAAKDGRDLTVNTVRLHTALTPEQFKAVAKVLKRTESAPSVGELENLDRAAETGRADETLAEYQAREEAAREQLVRIGKALQRVQIGGKPADPQYVQDVLKIADAYDRRMAALGGERGRYLQRIVDIQMGQATAATRSTEEQPQDAIDMAGAAQSLEADQITELEQPLGARVPTGKNRAEDPLTEPLQADMATVLREPKLVPKMRAKLEALGVLPNVEGEDDASFLKRFINFSIGNLLALHDAVPPAVRARARLWYDGATKLSEEWAAKYGVEKRAVAGVLAVLSPQKDWYQNVDLGRRVLDTVTDKKKLLWEDRLIDDGLPIILASAESSLKSGKPAIVEGLVAEWRKSNKGKRITDKIKSDLWAGFVAEKRASVTADFEALRGRNWEDLSLVERGRFIRLRDTADNPQTFRLVTPEGSFGDLVTTKDGKQSTVIWAGYANVGKAASIIENQSLENISSSIGNEHKVRNFYNNIFDPKHESGFVTIDTHAVAAALMRPLSGTNVAVTDNFGSPSNADTGISGTYAIYAEAYRQAAAARGLLPREMQSITWEAVRGLFEATTKRDKDVQAKIKAEWAKYVNKEQTYDETIRTVSGIVGGVTAPTWFGTGPDSGRTGAEGQTADQGELPSGGWPVRAVGRGDRGDSAAVDPADLDGDLKTFLGRPGWSVVTGTQEAMGPADNAANKKNNADLEAELREKGIQFVKVQGVYQGEDQDINYLIFADTQTAEALGAKYKQQSVLTKEGLEYTDGSNGRTPSSGVIVGEEATKQEYYTRLPDGRAFSMILDFDKTAPRGTEFQQSAKKSGPPRTVKDAVAAGKPFRIIHWSSRDADTLNTDPKFAGTAGAGTEKAGYEMGLKKRTYFGLLGRYRREGMLGAHAYEMTVDPKQVYDGYADPLGFKAQAAEKFKKTDRMDPDQKKAVNVKRQNWIDEQISKAGFTFVYSSKEGPYGPVLYTIKKTEGLKRIDDPTPFISPEQPTPTAAERALYLEQPVFHGTRKDFPGLPKITDGFAVHVGTEKAAKARLRDTKKIGGKPRVIEMEFEPSQPLKVNLDPGYWDDPYYIMEALLAGGDIRRGLLRDAARRGLSPQAVLDAFGVQALPDAPLRGDDDYLRADSALTEFRYSLAGYKDNGPRGKKVEGGGRENDAQINARIRQALIALGYDSVEYVNGFEAKGSVSYAVLDEAKLQQQYMQQFGDAAPRASVQPTDKGYLIKVFQDADMSSVLHELSHTFLLEFESLIKSGQASRAAQKDWQALMKQLGVKDGTITRDQHEVFARWGELYFMEGKAPAAGLLGAFQRFSHWLKTVYSDGKNAGHFEGVRLNDDVRRLFDRLLASEEDAARAVFQAEMTVRSDKELKGLDLAPDEKQHVNDVLEAGRAKLEADLSRARNRQLRPLLKKWKAEAKAEADKEPVYAALSSIKEAGGLRWSRMKFDFGQERINALRKAHGDDVIAKKENDGAQPEEIAERHGFESVEDMFVQLEAAPRRAEWEKAIVDQKLRNHDFGFDPMEMVADSEEFAEAAELMAQYYGRAIAAGERVATTKAVKERAQKIMAEMAIGEAVRHDKFIQQVRTHTQRERRAALKGDFETALRHNEKARLALQMAAEATRLKERRDAVIEKAKNEVAAPAKGQPLKVAAGHMENIAALMIRYGLGLRKAAINPKKPTLASLFQDVDGVHDLTGQFNERFFNEADAVPFQRLSVEEFESLAAMLDALERMGRDLANDFINEGKARLADVVSQSTGWMSKLKDKSRWFDSTTTLGKMAEKINTGLLAALTQMDFIFRAADGFNGPRVKDLDPNRPLTKHLVIRGDEAAAEAERRFRDMHDKLKPHLDVLAKALGRLGRKPKVNVPVPEFVAKGLGIKAWTNDQLLAMALNMGNAYNRQGLARGLGWDAADEAVMPAELLTVGELFTAQEWQAVQGIWDAINTLKPDLFKAHEKMFGFAPAEVEPTPFKVRTADGQLLELKGGYYPVRFDPKLSLRQAGQEEAQSIKDMFGAAFAPVSAKRGMTIARKGTGGKPFLLDPSRVLRDHVEFTVRFITHGQFVRDTNRLFINKDWAEMFVEKFGRPVYEELNGWLRSQVVSEYQKMTIFDDVVEKWRPLTSLYVLGLRVKSAVSQVDALASLPADIGVGNYLKSVSRLATSPKQLVADFQNMLASSTFMRERLAGGRDREMNDLLRDVNLGQFAKVHKAKKIGQHISLAPIIYPSLAMEFFAWNAMYQKAIGEGKTAAEAVTLADVAISSTQPANRAKDLSRMQRDKKGAARLLTMLMSFSIRRWNANNYMRRAIAEGQVSATDSVTYGFLTWIVAPVLPTLILALLWNDWDDEDALKKLGIKAASDLVSYQVQGIPLARDAIMTGVDLASGDNPKDAVRTAADTPIRLHIKAAKGLVDLPNAFAGEDTEPIWALADLASYYTGIPVVRAYKDLVKGWEQYEDDSNPVKILIPKPKE